MTSTSGNEPPMVGDISEEDVYAAMQRIPGYIDITIGDFLEIYRLARDYARERLLGQIRADELMRDIVHPLTPDLMLGEAARLMVNQRLMQIPVVDSGNRVLGVVSDEDALKRFGHETVLGLLAKLQEDPDSVSERCRDIHVAEVMSIPATTVRANARYEEISDAFRAHGDHCLPVVDEEGRLRGLLEYEDFIRLCMKVSDGREVS